MTTYPSTFTAQLAQLDTPTTFLAKHEDGSFSIQWAGCFYGPAATLAEIANSELLTLAESTAASEETQWRTAAFTTCEIFGPTEDEDEQEDA
jgi:hypothetical protein